MICLYHITDDFLFPAGLKLIMLSCQHKTLKITVGRLKCGYLVQLAVLSWFGGRECGFWRDSLGMNFHPTTYLLCDPRLVFVPQFPEGADDGMFPTGGWEGSMRKYAWYA